MKDKQNNTRISYCNQSIFTINIDNINDFSNVENICLVFDDMVTEKDYLTSNNDYPRASSIILDISKILENFDHSEFNEKEIIEQIANKIKALFPKKHFTNNKILFIPFISHGFVEEDNNGKSYHTIQIKKDLRITSFELLKELEHKMPYIFNKNTIIYFNNCRSSKLIDDLSDRQETLQSKIITTANDDEFDFLESTYNFRSYRFIFDKNIKNQFINLFGEKNLDLFYFLPLAYNHGGMHSYINKNIQDNNDITKINLKKIEHNDFEEQLKTKIIKSFTKKGYNKETLEKINDFIIKNLKLKSLEKQNSKKEIKGIIEARFLYFIMNRQNDLVEEMIRNNPEYINIKDAKNHNPLSIALEYNNAKAISLLSKYLTPQIMLQLLQEKDFNGCSGLNYMTIKLIYSIYNKNTILLDTLFPTIKSLVKNFIEKGILPDLLKINCIEDSKQTLLHLLFMDQDFDIISKNIIDKLEPDDLINILSKTNSNHVNAFATLLSREDEEKFDIIVDIFDKIGNDAIYNLLVKNLKNNDKFFDILLQNPLFIESLSFCMEKELFFKIITSTNSNHIMLIDKLKTHKDFSSMKQNIENNYKIDFFAELQKFSAKDKFVLGKFTNNYKRSLSEQDLNAGKSY